MCAPAQDYTQIEFFGNLVDGRSHVDAYEAAKNPQGDVRVRDPDGSASNCKLHRELIVERVDFKKEHEEITVEKEYIFRGHDKKWKEEKSVTDRVTASIEGVMAPSDETFGLEADPEEIRKLLLDLVHDNHDPDSAFRTMWERLLSERNEIGARSLVYTCDGKAVSAFLICLL